MNASLALPQVLWVGSVGPADMRLARGWVAELALVSDAGSAAAAVVTPPDHFIHRSPAVILLGADAPGRWSLADVTRLAIRWPLAPIVSVAATLVDGRRRSGPALPGIEEVPWHDLPGRLACWLAARAAGRPGTLGLPATARREDRYLQGVCEVLAEPPLVSVAAERGIEPETICDLVAAAGAVVGRRSRGRPPLDESSPVVLWDVGRLTAEHVAWVGMLAANRPGLTIILLDSFPRPDTTLAALRAGASAVLGRPPSAEALAGTLARCQGGIGLSRPAADR